MKRKNFSFLCLRLPALFPASINDLLLDLVDPLLEVFVLLFVLFVVLIHFLLVKLYFCGLCCRSLLRLGLLRWCFGSFWLCFITFFFLVFRLLYHVLGWFGLRRYFLGLNDFGLFDGFVGVGRDRLSLGGVDHLDELLGVPVDSEGDLLVLIVVNSVEVAQEELPKDEVLVVEFI